MFAASRAPAARRKRSRTFSTALTILSNRSSSMPGVLIAASRLAPSGSGPLLLQGVREYLDPPASQRRQGALEPALLLRPGRTLEGRPSFRESERVADLILVEEEDEVAVAELERLDQPGGPR